MLENALSDLPTFISPYDGLLTSSLSAFSANYLHDGRFRGPHPDGPDGRGGGTGLVRRLRGPRPFVGSALSAAEGRSVGGSLYRYEIKY